MAPGEPHEPQGPEAPEDPQAAPRDLSGTSQMHPIQSPQRSSKTISTDHEPALEAFVEHRFKNSPGASSHKPSACSQQPAASNQTPTSIDPQPAADSKPRMLFLQPSLHAIAGAAQQISIWGSLSTQPGQAECAERLNKGFHTGHGKRQCLGTRERPSQQTCTHFSEAP